MTTATLTGADIVGHALARAGAPVPTFVGEARLGLGSGELAIGVEVSDADSFAARIVRRAYYGAY